MRHTTTSWIVHVETLYGRSPGELVTLAKNLADRVAKGLMIKYGCVLGDGQINLLKMCCLPWLSCVIISSLFDCDGGELRHE